MPFDLNKEKMRCLMVLDDVVAGRLSCAAGPAYWRAFIMEDRATHLVRGEFRFKYDNGEKNWFQSQPKVQTSPGAEVEKLRCELEDILKKALEIFGLNAAAVENARAFLAVQKEFGSFDKFLWQFVGGKPLVNRPARLRDIPARTEISCAMSRGLKKRGFKFVGPTICYAFMQAVGMVNDHTTDCFRYKELLQ